MIRNPDRSRRRLIMSALAATLVAGCAAPGSNVPTFSGDFHRTGRFSISVQHANGQNDAVQGGFVWLDTGSQLRLDLTNPMGSTLARVTVDRRGAVLTRSNGQQEAAPDPDALVESVLGSPVPVAGLRYWLHGETGDARAGDVETDTDDHLAEFIQQGWRVRLSRYDALGPTLLQLNRNDAQRTISVRLAVSAAS